MRQILPVNVRLLDPAIGLASQLDQFLGTPTNEPKRAIQLAKTRFCVTSDPSGFASRAMNWLGEKPQVELVSLQCPACAL